MKTIIGLALAASATLFASSAAEARDGCGPGYHRGAYGHCRVNGDRVGVAVAPGLVIGRFYTGRGYWDGRNYYQRRERWHGGWRYR